MDEQAVLLPIANGRMKAIFGGRKVQYGALECESKDTFCYV
jgi:hypothetical protein